MLFSIAIKYVCIRCKPIILELQFLSKSLLENSNKDMALNLIAINKLRLSDVWGSS